MASEHQPFGNAFRVHEAIELIVSAAYGSGTAISPDDVAASLTALSPATDSSQILADLVEAAKSAEVKVTAMQRGAMLDFG